MISYRKAAQLRIERMPAPQPPFCCASVVSPYGTRRETPLSLDLSKLAGYAVDRGEAWVASDAVDLISREEELHELATPVLIEAAGYAESVFGRGSALASYLTARDHSVTLLLSPSGSLAEEPMKGVVTAIVAWPPRLDEMTSMFDRVTHLEWGVFVPVIFPLTTDLPLLERIADAAAAAGARFLAAASIELDAAASRAVAEMMGEQLDDETYETIFHGDVEMITLATERHVAALAAERGVGDFVPLPEADSHGNWAASAHLARAGSRIVRMDEHAERGWSYIRSAAAIAALEKPLDRIAEAADVAIVKSIEPPAAEIVREWLRDGTSAITGEVDHKWRLRRDYSVEG